MKRSMMLIAVLALAASMAMPAFAQVGLVNADKQQGYKTGLPGLIDVINSNNVILAAGTLPVPGQTYTNAYTNTIVTLVGGTNKWVRIQFRPAQGTNADLNVDLQMSIDGILSIATGGVTLASIDNAGNFIASNNITAGGNLDVTGNGTIAGLFRLAAESWTGSEVAATQTVGASTILLFPGVENMTTYLSAAAAAGTRATLMGGTSTNIWLTNAAPANLISNIYLGLDDILHLISDGTTWNQDGEPTYN